MYQDIHPCSSPFIPGFPSRWAEQLAQGRAQFALPDIPGAGQFAFAARLPRAGGAFLPPLGAALAGGLQPGLQACGVLPGQRRPQGLQGGDQAVQGADGVDAVGNGGGA